MFKNVGSLIAINFFLFVFCLPVHAQETKKASDFLVGSWIGIVEGETATRLLNIKKIAETDNKLNLESIYGMTSATNPAPIGVEATQSNEGMRLRFVTGSNSVVDVTQKSENIFEGTFLPKGASSSKKVQFEKVDERTLATRIAEQRDPFRSPPGSDVPQTCAKWFGLWGGRFSNGNIGEGRLWITKVDSACSVTYAYVTSTLTGIPPGALRNGKIENKELSTRCGTNGVCVFSHKDDQIWVTYSNPIGGSNNAVFMPIKR